MRSSFLLYSWFECLIYSAYFTHYLILSAAPDFTVCVPVYFTSYSIRQVPVSFTFDVMCNLTAALYFVFIGLLIYSALHSLLCSLVWSVYLPRLLTLLIASFVNRVGSESETASRKISGTSPRTVRVESEKAAPESENMALLVRKLTAAFREMA